jgi:dihydropteroate synthase
MGPVLRISGHGTYTITLTGLTTDQTTALAGIIHVSRNEAGPDAASFSFFQHRAGDVVLTGAPDQLNLLSPLLSADKRFPPLLARRFDSLLDNYLRSDYKIDCRGKILDLGVRTHIMGVLNATPDSFSDGGHFVDPEKALAHAREMAAAGADIIDIGGESTRPGAAPLSEEEELRRIIPLIERLASELAVPISVDTYKSSVAKKAIEAGAGIVNDISGLRFSHDMASVVADSGAAVIIMHIKGTPRDMQQDPVYDDVVGEVLSYLAEGIEIAMKAGVGREKILIDPGIGFGKTLEHNLVIMNRLEEFRALGRPILLGPSRKKFIGMILGVPAPEQRVDGTAANVAIGIEHGARVLRVHDVARMAQVAKMTDAIINSVQSTEYSVQSSESNVS